ncbi:hypothetical protein ACP4OV_009719 [Aristida adscensionis]
MRAAGRGRRRPRRSRRRASATARPVVRLQPWLGISVTEFKKKAAEYRASSTLAVPGADADTPTNAYGEEQHKHQQEHLVVTCCPESTLGEAIEAAAARHVERLWVVDEEALQLGRPRSARTGSCTASCRPRVVLRS